MYTDSEYADLVGKYGHYGSWAIWDYQDPYDTTIIDRSLPQLHPRFVLLGLNISRLLDKPAWSNFHDNTHARKLKYACNDSHLRGSYLTDIYKDIVAPRSTNFESRLTDEIIRENVRFFHQEMEDIKVSPETQFIVFGTPDSILARHFNRYFRGAYNNAVLYY